MENPRPKREGWSVAQTDETDLSGQLTPGGVPDLARSFEQGGGSSGVLAETFTIEVEASQVSAAGPVVSITGARQQHRTAAQVLRPAPADGQAATARSPKYFRPTP